MPHYFRSQEAGATYFFTLTLAQRKTSLLTDHIDWLRLAYQRANTLHPFKTIAICILPDHIHAIWQMPAEEADYGLRWRMIKSQFSRYFSPNEHRSSSKIKHREKGIWQRRYWEHQIRDDVDMQRHVDYIHYNPVKHGLVSRVRDWPQSTFHKHVAQGMVNENWGGYDEKGVFGE